MKYNVRYFSVYNYFVRFKSNITKLIYFIKVTWV